jgi:hypothetical protein
MDDFRNCLRRYVPRIDIDARLAEMKANAVLRQEAKAQAAERLKKEADDEKAAGQGHEQDWKTSIKELAGLLSGAPK